MPLRPSPTLADTSRRASVALQLIATVLLSIAVLAAPVCAQGVRVALLPAQQTVAPGSEFEITLQVPQVGSAFNGFDAVVGYNPTALTLLPLAPTTLQQGCLMTGGCSAACGSTFHTFAAQGDSAAITSIMLCDQFTLTGPGQIYRLRFRASNTPQITELTIRQATFFNAGLYVNPVTTTGCRVGIGSSLGVGDGSSPSAALRLTAEPNPAFRRVSISFASGLSGEPSVLVTDVLGRTVRRFTHTRVERGEHRIDWDGRDDQGSRVPAGVYLVRLSLGEQTRQTRVTLLQ